MEVSSGSLGGVMADHWRPVSDTYSKMHIVDGNPIRFGAPSDWHILETHGRYFARCSVSISLPGVPHEETMYVLAFVPGDSTGDSGPHLHSPKSNAHPSEIKGERNYSPRVGDTPRKKNCDIEGCFQIGTLGPDGHFSKFAVSLDVLTVVGTRMILPTRVIGQSHDRFRDTILSEGHGSPRVEITTQKRIYLGDGCEGDGKTTFETQDGSPHAIKYRVDLNVGRTLPVEGTIQFAGFLSLNRHNPLDVIPPEENLFLKITEDWQKPVEHIGLRH